MAHFHALRVQSIRPETEDAVSIVFEIPADLAGQFRYVPGQYLTLRRDFDGTDVRRSYSICSGADDGDLRVAVKAIPGGVFSTWATTQLKAGETLQVMEPAGRFGITPDPGRAASYVLFAAGSGITPVLAILKSLLSREPGSDVTLFYGNRNSQSIMFREELEDLKNRYMGRLRVFHVLSRERQEVDLFNGRIDRAKVADLLKVLVDATAVEGFYLCGPEGMVEDVKAALAAGGVEPGRIHAELFTAPGASKVAGGPTREETRRRAAASGEVSHVTVIMDGDRWDFDMPRGDYVLDAGQEAGLDLPFACKGGVCATCRAKVVEGQAVMDQNWGLEPEEVEAGYVLTCQARPASDRMVVDFDQP